MIRWRMTASSDALARNTISPTSTEEVAVERTAAVQVMRADVGNDSPDLHARPSVGEDILPAADHHATKPHIAPLAPSHTRSRSAGIGYHFAPVGTARQAAP